ncbi:hypothetical protein EB001_22585 [bacterium]|nr:hypothetical protein [bacterium]
MRVFINVDDITWQCGDCGNVYDLAVNHCPNFILDKALLEQGMLNLNYDNPAKNKKGKKK